MNKLFEFMHELHPGVQDMACDTFLKIAQKCRRKFVILQVPPPSCRRRVAPPPPPPPPPLTPPPPSPPPPSPQVGEAMPFIDELCLNVRQIISDLEPSQVQTFYEAVGYMVSAQADSAVRDGLLNKLMEWPNQNWHTILEAAKQSNGARAARPRHHRAAMRPLPSPSPSPPPSHSPPPPAPLPQASRSPTSRR